MSYQKNYPNGWQSGEAGGTPITPEAMNNIENGIANSLPKDGTDPMAADLPMGGNRVTGLGAPVEDGDAVPLGYARKIGNPHNLLDNSDFRNPVNQRGQTRYSTPGYTIDRWRIYNEGESVVVNAGYISKTGNLMQLIEGLDASKKYTAAICENDGTVSVYTGTIDDIGGWGYKIYCNVNTDGHFVFRITSNANNIKWAALYEGEYTAETLPEYQPKGYGAELLECRRYYQELDYNALGNGYTIGTGSAAILIVNTGVQMRVTPSIVGTKNFTVRTNGLDYTATATDSAMYECGNAAVCEIRVYNGDIPAKQTAAFYATEKVALSADL